MLADVTRVTRSRAIDAQSLVKEQLLAERHLFGRHGIVCGDWHRFVTGKSGWERLSFWGSRCRRRRRTGNRFRVLSATDEYNDEADHEKTNFPVDHKMLLTLVSVKCLEGFS